MPQSHITVEWTLVEADAARKRRHDRSAAPLVNAKQPLRGWRWWLSLAIGQVRCRHYNKR